MEEEKFPQGMGEEKKPEDIKPEGIEPPEPVKAKAQTPFKKKKAISDKSISVISWILVVAFLISTGILFKSKNRLTKEKELLQEQLNVTIFAKEAVQKKLEDAEAVTSKLQAEMDVIMAQAQALAREVAAEKAAKSSIGLKLKASVEEVKSLRQNLKVERAEKTALTQSLTEIARTKGDLQEQLDELKMAKKSLEKKLKAVLQKSGISLEKIVIKPEGRETSREGQILVVNKEFDFVVINLGLDDGLDIGDVLEIFSGDQVMGKVQVEKIYGNMSAATILPESQKNKIKEGHLVRAL